MRIRQPAIRKARVEIVPMIDTIFFLLVFFMMSTLSMVKMQGLGLALPKDAGKGTTSKPTLISLSISPGGQYFLDKKPLEVTELPTKLSAALAAEPNATVVVNVADTQKTQTLVSTLDVINEMMQASHNTNPILVATPKDASKGEKKP